MRKNLVNAQGEIEESTYLAVQSAVKSLEESRVDSLASAVTTAIVSSAINSLDTIDIDSIREEVAYIIRYSIEEGILNDSTQQDLRNQLDSLLMIVDKNLIIMASNLGDQASKEVIKIRNELLSDHTSDFVEKLVSNLTKQMIVDFREGYDEHLEEVVDTLFLKTQRLIDNSADEANRTIKNLTYWAYSLGALILVALIFLYHYFRTAKKNEDAFLSTARAIDKIPNRDIYEKVKSDIANEASTANQRHITKLIGRRADDFGMKKQYKDHQLTASRVLIKYLDPAKKQDVLANAEKIDPNVRKLIETEIENDIEP